MDFKTQVIQEYLSGGTSYRQLSAKYGMSRDVINKWVMIHQGIHNLPLAKLSKVLTIAFTIPKSTLLLSYFVSSIITL